MRLDEWAENYHVYIVAHAGFRKGMGTTDNIFVLHSLISHCVNEKKEAFCSICRL